MTQHLNITDLMNTRYKAYALYLIHNRAIPTLTDGMKPVQRKSFYTALKVLKPGNTLKVSALGGYLSATAKYHHGNVSAEEAIIGMTQDFNVAIPYFEGVGDFGSLYSPYAGASRYIEIKHNPLNEYIYKDNDLCEHIVEEGETIEPVTFLPIIPTVLCNSTQGVAIAYASNIHSRNPLQLIDACVDYIKTNKLDDNLILMPFVNGHTGDWVKYSGDKIEHWGKMKVVNSTTVEITGIPIKHTFESFEAHLNKCVEKEQIKEWYNESDKKTIKYIVKFYKDKLDKYRSSSNKWELVHLLSMNYNGQHDNLTMLDENGEIRRYANIAEVIKSFVDWRKTIYTKRKTAIIARLNKSIIDASNKIKFIKLVNNGDINLNSINSRDEATQMLDKFDLPIEMFDIKVYNLTKDELVKLKNQLSNLHKELEDAQKRTETQMYLDDLKELRNALVKAGYTIEPLEQRDSSIWIPSYAL